MKTIFFSIVLILCGFCLFSCSNDEVFSCDPEIDGWVKENLDDIQKMTRAEWLTLNEEVKGPAFSVFSSSQKISFWEEKISEVLTLGWSEKERMHIEKLRDFISIYSKHFDSEKNLTDEERKDFDISAYNWIEYAKNELSWDAQTIGSIVASGNKLINTKGSLEFNENNRARLKSGGEAACNCNQKYDFCSSDEKCSNTDCEERNYCGWLLLSKCNGRCEYD